MIKQFITYEDLGLTPQGSNKSSFGSSDDLFEATHAFLETWEGFEVTTYPDPATGAKPYTVGAGLTFKPDKSEFGPEETYSEEQLRVWEKEILQKYFIPKLLKHPNWNKFTAGQQVALISFAWNLGADFVGNYQYFASINRIMDSNDWSDCERVFRLYAKGDGKYMLGLDRRRYSEALVAQGMDPRDAYKKAQSELN